MLRFLFLFLFLAAFSSVHAQHPEYARAKVQLDHTHAIDALQQLGVICHGHHAEGRHFTSDFSYAEIQAMQEAGYTVEILIADVQAHYEQISQQPHTRDADCGNGTSLPSTPQNFELGSMGGYYTYAELLAELDSMHSLYPQLISARAAISDTLLTHEGRPVYWLRISDNPEMEEAGEPQILYNALTHAREPGGMQQLVYYMWYLLENYDQDPEIKYLVDEVDMYFIPCVNPDGYLYNESTNPNGGGMWRKNRRDNGNGTFGVDLNRNFGYSWAYDDTGSSPNPASDTYRGMAAFSEPETQLLKMFAETHDLKICLNYHTYSSLLLRPWAHINELPADIATFDAFGQKMVEANGYEYGGNEVIGYFSNGDSDGYMYGDEGIFSFTPEVGTAFWTSNSETLRNCQINLPANLYAARFVLNYGIVKEATTNPQNLPNLDATLDFNLQKYGLAEGSLTVSLSSPSIISVDGPFTHQLQHLEEESLSFSFSLDSNLQDGDEVEFTLAIDNGGHSYESTFTKTYGIGDAGGIVFSSNGDDMQGWADDADWGIATNDYYSAPSSIADSPNGLYNNNSTYTLSLLHPIDLSNATDAYVTFQARWEIEGGYDYCQLRAWQTGANPSALCGIYTKDGSTDQDEGEPIWDGSKSEWVAEKMPLGDFLGNASVNLEFRLVSDVFIREDGFYFDDFAVVVKTESSTQTHNFGPADFQVQTFPNPAVGNAYIEWEAGQNVEAISIRNALGQEIQRIATEPERNQAVVSQLPAGTYFYQLLSKGQTIAAGKLLFGE